MSLPDHAPYNQYSGNPLAQWRGQPCFALIVWHVPSSSRVSIDQNTSFPGCADGRVRRGCQKPYPLQNGLPESVRWKDVKSRSRDSSLYGDNTRGGLTGPRGGQRDVRDVLALGVRRGLVGAAERKVNLPSWLTKKVPSSTPVLHSRCFYAIP